MRVVILFSDTGGGHRAAARAVEAALHERDPSIEVVIKDGLVEGGPWPLNRSPAIYAWGMKWARWAWATSFHLSNGPVRARVMADLGYPATAKKLRNLIVDSKPDLLVSVHPLLTRSVARAIKKLSPRPPFAVVITDMVSGHWSWYDRGADAFFIPTEEAKVTMVRGGIDSQRISVTGQTVHPRTGRVVGRRDALRTELGWAEPTVLFVGGGDGTGGLGRFVSAAAIAEVKARLVVVCGRNTKLKAELEARRFPTPVEIHGFVDNLHELMAAADILVTKGGPGSIMEGCVAGLPMLIFDYIPGQEIGNVRLAEKKGFGRLVRKPAALVSALNTWLEDPKAREQAALASRAFGTPASALAIADGLLRLADKTLPAHNSPK